MDMPEGNLINSKTPKKSSPKPVATETVTKPVTKTPVTKTPAKNQGSLLKSANQAKFNENLKYNGILEYTSPSVPKAKTPVAKVSAVSTTPKSVSSNVSTACITTPGTAPKSVSTLTHIPVSNGQMTIGGKSMPVQLNDFVRHPNPNDGFRTPVRSSSGITFTSSSGG